MFIKQTKIINPTKYLCGIEKGKNFYIGIDYNAQLDSMLLKAGISIANKKNLLPKAIGRVTDFNRNGKDIVRTNLAKKNKFVRCKSKDWHGNTISVRRRYKVYPRDHINAPKIKLEVKVNSGNQIIISPKLCNKKSEYDKIKHVINLFLEIFGECNILQDNYMPAFKNIKRLNWSVLPKGEMPFDQLNQTITRMGKGTNSDKVIVKDRIKTIADANPDFTAIGQEGFHGYVIFGFKSKNKYILESVYKGNATYIFENDWQSLSKLSKAEILKGNKQLDRIIHDNNWKSRIKKYI